MTTPRRILGISLLLASAATFSGCQHHYKGYYRNYWRIPSHPHSTGNVQNTANVSRPSYQPDPYYAQQQNYSNQMQNYQRGYSNKLPNY